MSEEEVIKRRLIFDGDGTGEDRRLNVMLKMVSKWMNIVDETEDDCYVMCDKILAQLALVKHSRRRSQFTHKQTAKQLEKYKSLYGDMENNIKRKKNEIAIQKKNLEKAKIIKQNRIQYDLLAKAISKEPPRTNMLKNLKLLQKELADLAAQKKQLDHKLDSRKKQFSVLSTSANALSGVLANESTDGSKSSKENNSASLGSEPISE